MKTEDERGSETAGARGGEGFGRMLDRVLREREPFFDELFEGRNLGRNLRWFGLTIVMLSGFYGMTMGMAGLVVDVRAGLLQMLSSAIKVPVLYLLSVAVCYPVLFIVVVLMGSRLRFTQTLGLILLALTLNSVLLASCAPIVLFFFLTGASYHFLKLLHVVIMGFSGCWAMLALWQGLQTACEKSALYPKRAVRILQVWALVFGFVGTQMAWSLRPFVGSPGREFQWLRLSQESNFYEAIWDSVRQLGKE